MAKANDNVKAYIMKKILELFGDNAFEYDKKIYVNKMEGGENIQVAISFTCPKTQLEFGTATRDGGIDFDALEKINKINVPEPASEITEEELDNVKKLLDIVKSF